MGEREEVREEEICPIPCDSSAITRASPEQRWDMKVRAHCLCVRQD